MAETNFLSFLVNETLKLQKNGEARLSSLELKLKDYKLNFIKGEFIPQSQVLRFESHFGRLDFPINWSVFSIESESSNFVLEKDNDKDCLFSILSSAWNKSFTKILVTHADGFCYLVGLEAGDECRLRDIINPQQNFKVAS